VTGNGKKVLAVYLDIPFHNRVKAAAAERGLSLRAAVAMALASYFEISADPATTLEKGSDSRANSVGASALSV